MRTIPTVLLCLAFAACNQPLQQPAAAPTSSSPVTNTEHKLPPEADLSLAEELAEAPQRFTIAAGSTSEITAAGGLRLEVNTADLEAEDGTPVSGPVALTIKELTNPKQLVANDCPTVSDGKLLETAGAYFIGAEGSGRNLRLKKGRSVKVQFPKRGSGMELFYGQRNPDGSMNWKPLQQKLTAPATAWQDWEKKNRAAPMPDIQMTNAYTGGGTGRFLNTEAWFKAYHDTIVERRRSIIRKNFRNMTQPQIRKVMEAPYKMSVDDMKRIRKNTKPESYITCGRGLYYTLTQNGYDLLITGDAGADSVYYSIDSFRFRRRMAEALARRQTAGFYNSRTAMETVVDSIPQTKKRTKLTTPGRIKVTVSCYEPVELSQLGWINVDKFYDYPDGLVPEFTLDIKGAVPPAVGVYIIYKNLNGVMSAKAATDGKSQAIIRQQLPLHAKVDLLVYTKVNNRFLQYKQTATVTRNMVIPVELQPVPGGQIKKYLVN